MFVAGRAQMARRLAVVALMAALAAVGSAPASAALTEVLPPFISKAAKTYLSNPTSVAIEPNADGSAAHVYVGDELRDVAVQYTPDGQTDGAALPTDYPVDTANSGALTNVSGVAVDPVTHDLYIDDARGQRILEVDPSGVPIRQTPGPLAPSGCPAGCPNPSANPGHFATATDLTFDGSTLIVDDPANTRLQTFDSLLNFGSVVPVAPAAQGVAADPVTHELFIGHGKSVDVLTAAGVFERQIGAGTLSGATQVALDAPTHVLFVSDGVTNTVDTFDEATGAPLQSTTLVDAPAGIAIDAVSRIAYVTDPNGATVRRFRFSAPPACTAATAQTAPSVPLALSCTDPDGAPVTYALVQPPAHGTASIDPSTGQATYTAQPGNTAADAFTFRASSTNGTGPEATVSIAAALPAPPPAIVPPALVPPALVPPPSEHHSVDIARAGGLILVRLPGTKSYVPLSTLTNVPLGSFIDARHGRVTVQVAIDAKGDTQTGTFYGGRFQVLQTTGADPVANMRLFGGAFRGKAPKDDTGHRARFASHRAKRKAPKAVRHLWGDVHGRFRTTGHGASASVRGTNWLVTDYPTWTSVRVVRGIVSVRDFVQHKTVLVKAGHAYTTPHQGATVRRPARPRSAPRDPRRATHR